MISFAVMSLFGDNRRRTAVGLRLRIWFDAIETRRMNRWSEIKRMSGCTPVCSQKSARSKTESNRGVSLVVTLCFSAIELRMVFLSFRATRKNNRSQNEDHSRVTSQDSDFGRTSRIKDVFYFDLQTYRKIHTIYANVPRKTGSSCTHLEKSAGGFRYFFTFWYGNIGR